MNLWSSKLAVYLSVVGAAVELGLVLSFSAWSAWRPLGALAYFAKMSFFDLVDFVSSNVLLPIGAILTCILLGWPLVHGIPGEELEAMSPSACRAVIFSLRWLSPIAIAAVLSAALV